MNQNPPLTPEKAKNLTFPCLLEVWCFKSRAGVYDLITHITERGHFATATEAIWHNAALPSLEITEAMRKQFGTQSEYPKRMLVWDYEEEEAEPRIVLADFGEKTAGRYIAVYSGYEKEFQNRDYFSWRSYNHAKPISPTDPISQEIAKLR